MYKKISIVFVCLALVISVVLIPEENSEQKKGIDTKTDSITETKRVYTLKPVLDKIGSNFMVNGRVNETLEVIDASAIQGKVVQVYVKKGQTITAGSPLIQLDTTGELDQIDFQMKQISASLGELDLNKKHIGQQQEKTQSLFNAGAVSQEDLNTINNELDQYSLQVEKLKEQQALLQRSRDNIKARSIIKSSYEGVVTEISLEAGGYIGQSDKIMIKKNGTQSVELYLTEKHLKDVDKGKEVDVYIKDEHIQGHVTEVYGSEDNDYMFRVKISLKTDKVYKNGLMASVLVPTYENESALLIDTRAIINYGNDAYVYTVENEKVIKKSIETGMTVKDKTEVLSGLKPDDEVLVKGQYSVYDGQSVLVAKK